MPPLHVVFNPPAAAELRRALAQIGRDDRVVGLFDDLSFGPINPPDPGPRAQWMERELGWKGWEEVGDEVAAFWATALAHRGPRVAWMSRRSAQEYAGFLELVWRLGDSPCELVDLTEVTFTSTDKKSGEQRTWLAGSLGHLPAWRIVDANLLALPRALTPETRDALRSTWRVLRDENAALRVLRPNLKLISAPISFFDDQLLSKARADRWLKASRVVAETMASFYDDDLYQTGDLVLASRVHRLVETGRLQASAVFPALAFGEPPLQGEVRLPGGSRG
jgi:hypothetical protein